MNMPINYNHFCKKNYREKITKQENISKKWLFASFIYYVILTLSSCKHSRSSKKKSPSMAVQLDTSLHKNAINFALKCNLLHFFSLFFQTSS